MKTFTTCTRDGWNVGGMQRCGEEPMELSVFKVLPGQRTIHQTWMRKGDAYGIIFPTKDEAWSYALVHGYLQPYFRERWCIKHRCLMHPMIAYPLKNRTDDGVHQELGMYSCSECGRERGY